MAGGAWGLETGVLRMTHDAAISRLLRYALVVAGSCFPPEIMCSVNTQIVNIAAREIGGLGRSARIESLPFATGASAIFNLYIGHMPVSEPPIAP